MAVGKRLLEVCRSLREVFQVAIGFSVEPLPHFRSELYRVGGRGALWQARAFLNDCTDADFVTGGQLHAAHHAVMLAAFAAAGRKIGLGIRDEDWRNQNPAENHQQRECYGARPFHRVEYIPERN